MNPENSGQRFYEPIRCCLRRHNRCNKPCRLGREDESDDQGYIIGLGQASCWVIHGYMSVSYPLLQGAAARDPKRISQSITLSVMSKLPSLNGDVKKKSSPKSRNAVGFVVHHSGYRLDFLKVA